MIRFDELPDADALPEGRREGLGRYPADRDMRRRRFLRQSTRVGAGIGVAMLGAFRVSKEQAAALPPPVESDNGPPYNTYAYCGGLDPDDFWENLGMGFAVDSNQNGWYDPPGAGGTCSDDACVGTADILMGGDYCCTCSERNAQNQWFYHFIGTRGGFRYGDATDSCDADYNDPKDSWLWTISSCGYCAPSVWNCHDGYKQNIQSQEWSFSICQALHKCNNQFYNCP